VTECTYCGSDVYAHEPLFLESAADGDREQAGQFCNYACLSAYIDEENLTEGAACAFDPTG